MPAAYNPDDGVIFPWPFLWGYAQGAQKRGVEVETFTDVTGFETSNGQVRKVKTDRGRHRLRHRGDRRRRLEPGVAQLAGVSCPTSRTATRSSPPSRSSRS